ncbi:MAG: hypothetical protein WCZ87_03405 [Thiohalobacteraceae bacterium]
MKQRPVKNFIRRIAPGLFVLARGLKLIYSERSYLKQQGYWRSALHKAPMTLEGDALPWMNYGVIDFLAERLCSDMRMFEYGSGYSTRFYATRVQSVISVEHNRGWFERMAEVLPDNVSLRYAPSADADEYIAAAVHTGQKFDFIVVDGRNRVACIMSAVAALRDDGVMLLDDSRRERYQSGVRYLLENGFRQIRFCGLKPGSIESYCTSIFYRPGNRFGI